MHPNTKKRAEALGLQCTVENGLHIVKLPNNRVVEHADPKAAVTMAAVLLGFAHIKDITVRTLEDDYEAVIEHKQVPLCSFEPMLVPNIKKLLEEAEKAADELGLVLVPIGGKSVVSVKFKSTYGSEQSCGDWLANTLKEAFTTKSGFHYEGFTQCLIENGVETVGPWSMLPDIKTPGWQGRYRMNGRQKLQCQIIKNGEFIMNGKVVPLPQGLLEYWTAPK